MHQDWVSLLRCPESGLPLSIDIREQAGDHVVSGTLTGGVLPYPIVRGIPRFAGYDEANYSDSFGWQWRHWPRVQFESENLGRPMAGHTTRMFDRITGGGRPSPGEVVVDVGCGPGRFIEVARSRGARVIGVDYSMSVEAARKNFAADPNVLIVQADAARLPVRDGAVDGAFSIGVLHHTPDPAAGVRELSRILRPGAWGAICVYPKGGYYDFPTVQLWRKAFSVLWPAFGHRLPLAYAHVTVRVLGPLQRIPALGRGLRVFFPFVHLPDRRWSILDTFDSVTPSYQSAHESYEVFSWMRDAGFSGLVPGDWGPTAWHGTRGER